MDFDALEEMEAEHQVVSINELDEQQVETEEERKKREEAEFFRKCAELEGEAEARRHQPQPPEGHKLGVLIKIEVKDPSDPKKKCSRFFIDVFNEVFKKLHKLLYVEETLLEQIGSTRCRDRLDAVACYLDVKVQRFYRDDAVQIFDRLVNLLQGKAGIYALLGEMVEKKTPLSVSEKARRLVDEIFMEIIDCMRKLCDGEFFFSDKERQDAELHKMVLAHFVFPMVAVVQPELTIANADNVEIFLLETQSDDCRRVYVPRSWTVEELRKYLLQCKVLPAYAQLASMSKAGGPIPLRSGLKLDSLVSRMLVVQGIKSFSEGGQPEPDLSCIAWFLGFMQLWRTHRGKLWKTTAISASMLLYDLRNRFEQDKFQEQFHELQSEARVGNAAHTRRVALTFQVQSEILPKYGFEANAKGVQEMRDEMPAFAGGDVYDWKPHTAPEADMCVWMIRRHIHLILDMAKTVPRMPVARAMAPHRFAPQDKGAWLRHLVDNGYVVIAGVADDDQTRHAYQLLWDFIEQTDAENTIRRDDLTTWQDSLVIQGGWPAGKSDGIIHVRGIGQSQVLWFLRGLPTLKRVFADVWGTDQLVTSFDGAGVFRPYGHDPNWKIQKTDQGWCHVDQAHRKPGLHCVQGLITLKDATEDTGGLVVVPGSHRFFSSDILQNYKQSKNGWNFIEVRANDPVLTEGKGGPKLVCARAGDLILWDSRTIHCNTLPLRDNRELLHGNDLIRAVAYICMTPASWCSPDVAKYRANAFTRGVTTSHWPHEHHEMSATNRHPGFELSKDQWQLLCPPADLLQAPAPGRVSLMPAEHFRLVAPAVVRSSATFEWGNGLGTLPQGAVVSGYLFGKWLRLNSWPEGHVVLTEDPEAWMLCDGNVMERA